MFAFGKNFYIFAANCNVYNIVIIATHSFALRNNRINSKKTTYGAKIDSYTHISLLFRGIQVYGHRKNLVDVDLG